MSGMFSALSVHKRALNYHMERHNLLAGNIANADTPGFVSKDISFDPDHQDDFGNLIARHELDITDGNFDGDKKETEVFDDPSAAPGNDTNAVDMDREMAKVAANSMKFEAVATMVTKHLGMLRYGASDGR
ncbi:MAG: flagellar basal body rod protein FlgB [Deltaproteobacteria bacterium]|nr:flagellar basal body rod protein FlgB [Deltaproteobacteria bacterium]